MNEPQQPGPRAGTLVFSFCAVFGALVWLASPWLTGRREPWDADGFGYLGSLLAIGAISGLVAPRRYLACWGGVYAGQCVGMLLSGPIGSLAPLGFMIALPIASLISLVGAVGGSLGRYLATAVLHRGAVSESAPPD